MSDLEKLVDSGFTITISKRFNDELVGAIVINAEKINEGKQHYVRAFIQKEDQFSKIIEGFVVSLKRKGWIDV